MFLIIIEYYSVAIWPLCKYMQFTLRRVGTFSWSRILIYFWKLEQEPGRKKYYLISAIYFYFVNFYLWLWAVVNRRPTALMITIILTVFLCAHFIEKSLNLIISDYLNLCISYGDTLWRQHFCNIDAQEYFRFKTSENTLKSGCSGCGFLGDSISVVH